jgi:hypothetical protein
MMMVARRRLPSGFRQQPVVKMTLAARESMRAALEALYSDAPGLTGEAALAERERMKIEAEAAQRKQGVLHLRGGA